MEGLIPLPDDRQAMENADSSLVAVLRHCAATAPEPWYPSEHEKTTPCDRRSLDATLDRLRLGGLVQLTDWQAGTGQGYRLTLEGERVLRSPNDLERLQANELPAPPLAIGSAPEVLALPGRREHIRDALYEPPTPWLTYGLVLMNIGVFVWGLALAREAGLTEQFFSGMRTLEVWRIEHATGALAGTDLLRGEWYRLVTCCFVHIGVVHLFVNMFSLFFLGRMMEAALGRGRFLFLYLVSGIGGSCAMVFTDPMRSGAGASGALCGLMASYVVWLFLNRHHLPEPIGPSRVRNLVGIIFLNVLISMLPGISAAAHFGGALLGVLATPLITMHQFGGPLTRRLGLIGMVLLPALCLGALMHQRFQDGRWLLMEYREFNDRLTTVAKEQLDHPLRVYNVQVADVINFRPTERTPAQLDRAVQAAAREAREMKAIVEQLQQGGPYADATVAATRDAAGAVANAGVAFYEQVGIALNAGDDWKRAERVLTQRREELDLRAQTWQKQWAEFRDGWRSAQQR